MPACLPEQSELMRRRSGSAAAAWSSHGRTEGHCSDSSGTPALARSERTVATWTGSALCEAHMTATSASVNSNGDSESETVPWSGFIDDLA